MPPITTVASGRCTSAPGAVDNAMGTKPTMSMSAVIKTGRSLITVEPGGAVELSGPPAETIVPAISAMAADRTVLRSAFADAGLGLVLLGADPLRPVKRINPGDRYHAM